MKRIAVVLALFGVLGLSLATPARADLSEKLGALSGTNAAGYLAPLNKALSSTLNGGIFQSGSVPKSGFTFHVGVHVMGAEFADEDRTFMPTDPFGSTANTPTEVPTVIGPTGSVGVPDGLGYTPVYPGGLDATLFYLPVPELTVGDFAGTRATVRWFSSKLGDTDYGKIDLVGFGAQHSISQYVHMPVDVAVGGFYQTLKVGDDLVKVKTTHFDVTGSKKLGGLFQFEPYASLGFDTCKMDIAYTLTDGSGEKISVHPDGESNVHAAIGAQVSLAVVKLHAEWFKAAYTGAALGLSLGL